MAETTITLTAKQYGMLVEAIESAISLSQNVARRLETIVTGVQKKYPSVTIVPVTTIAQQDEITTALESLQAVISDGGTFSFTITT